MNIFSGKIEENEAGVYLTHTKEAAQADIVDNRQERGPPDGKMSRDTGYKKVNQQAWRQIQRQRMTRYGSRFDTMPRIDAIHAHDMLFVVENFDESNFGVADIIDPAKNQAKANIVLEVMKDGNIEYAADYRRRVENLRSWQRRNAGNSVPAENTKAGTGDAGVSVEDGKAGERSKSAGESGGADKVSGKASMEPTSEFKPKRKVNAAEFSETTKQAVKDAQLAGMMNQGRKTADC